MPSVTSAMAAFNYFNYYTEIEEYFWRKRGAHLLVSPLDWAILETWQQAGIPLTAVLKGIDRAFESYSRSRRGSGKALKSLAYCVEAVLEAAEQEKEIAAGKGPEVPRANRTETFAASELIAYFARNRERLAKAADAARLNQQDVSARLAEASDKLAALAPLLDAAGTIDLEDLERRLTVIEEKLTAAMRASAPDDILVGIRRDLDRQLAPYRGKMTAAQLGQLELKYVDKRLWEHYRLPRLSLYYLS
ncbi:MAG: hypothetical protein WBF35_01690 [Candidatus Acidiferrales bacterium]